MKRKRERERLREKEKLEATEREGYTGDDGRGVSCAFAISVFPANAPHRRRCSTVHAPLPPPPKSPERLGFWQVTLILPRVLAKLFITTGVFARFWVFPSGYITVAVYVRIVKWENEIEKKAAKNLPDKKNIERNSMEFIFEYSRKLCSIEK